MHFYEVEDPHKPSLISLIEIVKCELCKALLEATDYDKHAQSHVPPQKENPSKVNVPRVGQ